MNDRMEKALREWAEAHGWFVDDDEYVDLSAHLAREGFVSVEEVEEAMLRLREINQATGTRAFNPHRNGYAHAIADARCEIRALAEELP